MVHPVNRKQYYKISFVCFLMAALSFVGHNILITSVAFPLGLSYLLYFFFQLFLLGAICFLFYSSIVYYIIERIRYNELSHFLKEKHAIFELIISSKEQYPLNLMEAFLNSFLTNDINRKLYADIYKKSTSTPVFSFEIVFDEGMIKFFLRAPKKFKKIILTNIHTFFPDIIVKLSADYVDFENYNSEEWHIWGCDWEYEKEDYVPIKNYKEIGLVGETKTTGSSTIDPLASLFEAYSNLVGTERAWTQFVFRLENREFSINNRSNIFNSVYWNRKEYKNWMAWKAEEIRNKVNNKEKAYLPTLSDLRILNSVGTLEDQNIVSVGIRTLYLAKKDDFKEVHIPPILNAFNLVSTKTNSIIPKIDFDYLKLTINTDEIISKKQEEIFQLYRNRLFWLAPAFYRNLKPRPVLYMPIELFVTICHLPSIFVKNSAISRKDYKTGQLPSRIPFK